MVNGDDASARLIRGQGRILEALAGDDEPLTGTLDRFEQRFGLAHEELRACLLEMAYAGWITVRIQPFGRVTIELQREGADGPPVTVVGVRSVPSVRCRWPARGRPSSHRSLSPPAPSAPERRCDVA